MDALKIIPQAFFDLIARVAPGFVALVLFAWREPLAWRAIAEPMGQAARDTLVTPLRSGVRCGAPAFACNEARAASHRALSTKRESHAETRRQLVVPLVQTGFKGVCNNAEARLNKIWLVQSSITGGRRHSCKTAS